MDFSNCADCPPEPSAIVRNLVIGLAVVLLACLVRRLSTGTVGNVAGLMLLFLAAGWYLLVGLALLYPHNHHTIWLPRSSYRASLAVDFGIGVAWISTSVLLLRRFWPKRVASA
jgi:hypothetical protein